MCAVDGVQGDVTSDVRPPTSQKRRTPIGVALRGIKYDCVTVENARLVCSMQCDAAFHALQNQIEILLVFRKLGGSPFANQFFYLFVGQGLILFRVVYVVVAQDFFKLGWSDAHIDAGLGIKNDEACDYTSSALKRDSEFMGDDASERPTEKVAGPRWIDLQDSVGIVLRHIANRARVGLFILQGSLDSNDWAVQVIA